MHTGRLTEQDELPFNLARLNGSAPDRAGSDMTLDYYPCLAPVLLHNASVCRSMAAAGHVVFNAQPWDTRARAGLCMSFECINCLTVKM